MIRGFVDLQVNGAVGVAFAAPDIDSDAVRRVGRRLYERGTEAYCPTVVTTSPAAYERCLPVLAEHEAEPGEARPLGIHLEGPFISPDDGPRGVHPREWVRPPAIEFFEQLRELARDRIAIVTLAPEMPGAVALIEHIVSRTRAVVSIGHTAADADAIHRAADAGARLATHVGNGIATQIHRHRNPLWAILADARLTAMCITDGFHLPPDVIRVILRAKTHERFIVASDLMPFAGLAPGEYDYGGVPVVLEANGHLRHRDLDQLAGSACDMRACMAHLAALGELSEGELDRVSRLNPLSALGLRP